MFFYFLTSERGWDNMTKLLALQQLDTNISERNTNKSNLSIVCDHGTGSTLSLHFCNSMGNF